MARDNHNCFIGQIPATVSPTDPNVDRPKWFHNIDVHNAAPIWQRLLAEGIIDESKCSAEKLSSDGNKLSSCGYMFSRAVHFTFKMDNAEEVHHLGSVPMFRSFCTLLRTAHGS